MKTCLFLLFLCLAACSSPTPPQSSNNASLYSPASSEVTQQIRAAVYAKRSDVKGIAVVRHPNGIYIVSMDTNSGDDHCFANQMTAADGSTYWGLEEIDRRTMAIYGIEEMPQRVRID